MMELNTNANVFVKTRTKRKSLIKSQILDNLDIIKGLCANQKYISSKYFYDERGSYLFEEICRLPEYYPTRTEISILEQIAPEIISKHDYSEIIELGSGESIKIKILFNIAVFLVIILFLFMLYSPIHAILN